TIGVVEGGQIAPVEAVDLDEGKGLARAAEATLVQGIEIVRAHQLGWAKAVEGVPRRARRQGASPHQGEEQQRQAGDPRAGAAQRGTRRYGGTASWPPQVRSQQRSRSQFLA